MRRGWKVPALYLATTCTSSHFALGFVSHQLSTAAKASAWKPASSLIYGSPSSGSTFTRRNMSSEVVPAKDYGPTDQSWRSLLEVSMARSRKIRGSNYVQISTATKDGEPRCRTVVFRGFLNNKNLPEDHPMSASGNVDGKPCVMKMCTDLRSNKVAEVAHQPISEMVWWFPKTSEQYRVRGSLLLVGDDSGDRDLQIARKELWGNLSDPARESFLDDKLPVPVGGRDDEGKVVPVPENFLLMLLDPIHVDFLRLTGAQYRQIDERQSGPDGSTWSAKSVKP
ncbi:unnamed protein product [Pseudo-nitzschia multistriata]|uniref:Pyridoxamine 5'-phosphate oxidase Alr4036 family FMN-binding domain-containing protein n=1 Tax=Pseudo-nitzschia multistriata TaxID=183589 RepID=A0A448ZRB0_9STRA|nr:unnamed protein product [Pseudo-nitzschia multistriata]